jgi:hypothetical protein
MNETKQTLTKTIKPLSSAKVELIIKLLKSSYSRILSALNVSTSVISKIHLKHCPDIPKSSRGYYPKLSLLRNKQNSFSFYKDNYLILLGHGHSHKARLNHLTLYNQ